VNVATVDVNNGDEGSSAVDPLYTPLLLENSNVGVEDGVVISNIAS
jgi:hypothetical protein